MLCGILCVLFLFIKTVNSYTVQVQVKQGTLIGVRQTTVFDRRLYYAFYGVPYAQPPVGDLRFKDPVQPKKYEKSFDATLEYRGACTQTHIVHKHGLYGNEDCLYMNIYTPSFPTNDKSKLKPVVVWIHGHAFTSSFSHIHGGDFFIENDVIVISVTHRIGAFGFLDIDELDAHANMGLKDIVLALKWIRKNIEKFNGDKHKITLMGCDSGATFTSLLLMTESGKLFSKVILQSGSLFSPSLFLSDPLIEKERLSEAVKKRTSRDLIKAPAKDILIASSKIYNSKEIANFQRPIIPFSPVVERKSNSSLIFTNPQKKNWKNLKLNIPLMIGFNSQESIAEVIPFMHNPHYLRSFSNFFKFMVPFTDSCNYKYSSNKYIEIAKKIKNEYFPQDISEKSVLDFIRYASDLNKYPVYKFIKTLTSRKNNEIYVYKFNYVGTFNVVKANSVPGGNLKVKGASKGDEVCYLMRCDPLMEKYVEVNNDVNNRDRKFIKELTEIWANFAKTGNPTPRPYFENITWLPMNKDNDNILLISSNTKLINSKVEKNMYSFWNNIYNDYFSSVHCKDHKHDEL